jgi:hypothetical protein
MILSKDTSHTELMSKGSSKSIWHNSSFEAGTSPVIC